MKKKHLIDSWKVIPLQGGSCNNSVIKIQLIRIKVRKYCFEKESYKFYIHKNFNSFFLYMFLMFFAKKYKYVQLFIIY